ncbi:hypothetical protein FPOAC2_14292 [Fusarium poae]
MRRCLRRKTGLFDQLYALKMCRAEARHIGVHLASFHIASVFIRQVHSPTVTVIANVQHNTDTQEAGEPSLQAVKKKKNVACSLRASNFSSAPSIGTTKDCSMDLTQSCQLWSGGHGSRIDGADSPGSVVSRDIPE